MREALKKVQPTEFEDLVALVALYRPGAMDQIPAYARGKRNPESITFIDDRLRPITQADQGRDPVPGAVDADRQDARGLQRSAGGRPAQGDRQEEPRGDGQAQADVRRGLPRLGHRARRDRVAVGDEREVGRLLLQQVPRGLLRADRLPDGVAEGELPGRVHGRADLVGDGHQGQGAVLRQPGGEHGDRDPAAGREPVRPRVRRRRGQHPLRPGCRQGRRLRGGRGDQGGARRGRPVHVAVGVLRAGRRPRGQQEGDRGADQVRRVRLDRRDPRAGCSRCSSRPRPPARRRSSTRRSARARSSTSAASAPARTPRRRRSQARPTRRSRSRSSTARSCWRSRRSRSASSSPSTRSSACATRCASRATRCAPRCPSGATASG